ncbi:hypothetical protein LIER_39607 [Lithospermum erythrorhizon]|uniref:Uncharacterized protein n=1 Tax=Lithospermum erythrorhizon TaxID=34254 RepID=A0AAV3QHE1_LITER
MSTSNPMSQNDVSNKKRNRDDTELESISTDSKRVNSLPDVDRIPTDILDILNDSDVVNDHDSPSQDLDSVIKSFEEEILQPPLIIQNPPEISDSEESQPDIGYLFGASNDELGLPSTTSTTRSPNKNEAKNDPIDSSIDTNTIEMGNVIEFEENELLSYDSFQLGLSEASKVVDENGFDTVDGLFDSQDISDVAGLTWQPESWMVGPSSRS